MKNRPLQAVALLLTFLFALPTPQLIALGQEAGASPEQETSKAESPEEKKLRKEEERRKKKEEERKRNEEKARAKVIKTYQTLTEFAEDLYASDPNFREQVDEEYMDLQRQHWREAHYINTSRRKELLFTENPGEVLELRRALYDNPRVQEYVNRIGQQIVPEDSEKLYSFKVTINPIPYAYTLSTGTVLISTGMVSQLDNEAQLAYVLAHELAHVYKDHWRIKAMLPLAEVEYNKRQERKRLMWASILTLAGAGMGAAVAGKEGAIIGAVAGLGSGIAVGTYYSRKIGLDWEVAQENEADDFALKATLGKSFDIQEVPRLFVTMDQVARFDSRTQLGFLGKRSRIQERTEYAQKLIGGSLQTQYQEALKVNKIKGLSPEFSLIMAELKRDNGIQALYFDMFQLARKNLEEAVRLRSDDPKAAYYYGRVLKEVGRTKEDLGLAQQSLLKAISLDTRQEIPEVQLHRALMLMDNKDSASQSEAIAALKSYIIAYGVKRATANRVEDFLPPNVDVLYGYMHLLGDKTWTAPTAAELLKSVSNNSSDPTAPPAVAPVQVVPASKTLSPADRKLTQKP